MGRGAAMTRPSSVDAAPAAAGLALAGPIQAQMVVGRPGDAFEREADSVAQRVTTQPSAPPPTISRLPPRFSLGAQRAEDEISGDPLIGSEAGEQSEPIQRACAECASGGGLCPTCAARQAALTAGGPPRVAQAQRRPVNLSPGLPTSAEADVIGLRGSGTPLPDEIRRPIEERLGYDFADVRIHTDGRAAASAKTLQARAYTTGRDVVFGAGEYAPETTEGQRLLAHELTHVVQQGAVTRPPPIGSLRAPTVAQSPRPGQTTALNPASPVRPPIQRIGPASASGPLVQRQPAPPTAAGPLYLVVPFKGTDVEYDLNVGNDVLQMFVDNPLLESQVEAYIGQIFTPATGPVQETTEFLSGFRVRHLIEQDLTDAVSTGQITMSRLSGFLDDRARVLANLHLLAGTRAWVQSNLGIDPATIDWKVTIAALQARLPKDPQTALEASDLDRYAMFLTVLANEASTLDPVDGARGPDLPALENSLQTYLLYNLPPDTFSAETIRIHSEKFLAEYLPAMAQIQYVPNGFDVSQFRPRDSDAAIARERNRILDPFMRDEAPNLMTMFVLDEWTKSGQAPEVWLARLDINTYKDALLDYLADKFLEEAKNDPSLIAALRVGAVERARFNVVNSIYLLARSEQQHNQSLIDRLTISPLSDLDDSELAVANDPAGYVDAASQVAQATQGLLSGITPGGNIERQLVDGAIGLASALSLPPEYGAYILLPELLSYLKSFQDLEEEQRQQARAAIKERINVDFASVAAVINERGKLADDFIQHRWLPTLKQIAVDRARQNRDELQSIYDNWDVARPAAITALTEGADELDWMAAGLEDGTYESIEVNEQVVTKDHAQDLRTAAQFMRDQAQMEADPKRSEDKKGEIKEAIDSYAQLRDDIYAGKYDPLDYSSAVYVEARQRLGIGEFPPATLVGQVLRGEVSAQENPFLARAIVFWHWSEGFQREIRMGALLVGLGILTVAAALVPGVGGLVLRAIDAVINIALAGKNVSDAYDLLEMARLDTHGDIRGVSVEAAEKAIHQAWIGLGVTILLTAGPLALEARAIMIEANGLRVDSEFLRWEASLEKETRDTLRANSQLRKVYAEMDPEVRRLLTLCETPCIPLDPPPSVNDVARIQKLVKRLNLSADDPALKEYLHVRRKKLTAAVDNIADVRTPKQLQARLDQAIAQRATELGGTASRGADGRWVFRRDGKVIPEYEIGGYGTLADEKKSGGFFQAHHGIQGEWASQRVPGYDYYGEPPSILLRDSRKGTPHQIVTARQAGRKATLTTSTYSEQRALLLQDMQEANVPGAYSQKLLSDSDAYFAPLYRNLEKKLTPSQLGKIFGTWKP